MVRVREDVGTVATGAAATTGATGVASSPLLTANSAAGSFTATAAVSGKEPTGGSGGEGSGASGSGAATPATFSLSNLAGRPAKLTTGVGSAQSTPAGTPFPIRLAVTATDAQKNVVPGALITFSAPTRGASGRFAAHARDPHHRRARVSHRDRVKVKTNACGIAVAPTFTANDTQGGYIVRATVKRARPAAFALVNVASGQSS
ncbi:MAG: repeat protein [Solirubrobacterales bacterium]|nr:repeat protein [Solirubrobacterales bacterium]